jgi:hypothetical protein
MPSGLVFLGVAVLVLIVLPSLLGADSRDGNDWVNHRRI